MPTQIQLRRGTTAEHSSFTGAAGELTVDTTKKALVVHDGSTAGGIPVARDSTVVHTSGAETVAGVKTLSSNPVLDAGTANGVVYLNGSKSATTGSVLTFDGTTIGWNAANIILNGTSTAASALFRVRGSTGDQWQFGAGIISAGDWGVTNATRSFNPFVIEGGTNTPYFVWNHSGSEQMRLTSTGLGIGTSSPANKLVVSNAGAAGIEFDPVNGIMQTYNRSGGAYTAAKIYALNFEIRTGSSPAANTFSIDSSGNLRIVRSSGDTTVGSTLYADGTVTCARSSSSNSDLNLYVYSTGAAAARFYVGMAGTVYATSTTITGISDVRLKENIRDLDDGLASIMALKPRKFDWKAGKGKDIKDDRGFIAQEFEQVFPDMIDEWSDPAPEGEEPYKAVNANLIPTLVKAIQELKAEFDAYKATHP